MIYSNINLCAQGISPPIFDLNKSTSAGIVSWKFAPAGIDDSAENLESIVSWESITLHDLETKRQRLYWLKKEIYLDGTINDADLLSISILYLPAAFDIYWDGILIGANGQVGKDSESEINGKVRYSANIGRKLSIAGLHQISIKISNMKNYSLSSYSWINFGYNTILNEQRSNQTFELAVYMGLFFAAFLFCISVYILGWRDHSFLFFSGFTLFYFLISLWYYLIHTGVIYISVGSVFNPIFDRGHSIALIILVFFTLSFFSIKSKWKHVIPLVIIAVVLEMLSKKIGFRPTINIMYFVFSSYSLVISLTHIKKKIAGTNLLISAMLLSTLYYLGSLVTLIFDFYFSLYEIINLFQNIIFVSIIMIAVSRKIQERNRKYQETLLLSHRLESELLKKSIQPHFIMNTLLSLKSWLIKDSGTAEKMIDSLANQFRIINKIASEKEIPLKEEIELCRSFLELMGYRLSADYKLIIEGDLTGILIPPLIFHTLIENGITHAYLPKESGTFQMSIINNNGSIHYSLRNDGSQVKSFSDMQESGISEGLGLKYVKARLEENYPGHWSISYGQKDNFWEVNIILKNTG